MVVPSCYVLCSLAPSPILLSRASPITSISLEFQPVLACVDFSVFSFHFYAISFSLLRDVSSLVHVDDVSFLAS